MTYLRFNSKDHYYGMTLIDNSNSNIPGWKKSELFLQKNKNIHIERGADNTGNLYNPVNYKYCLEKYGNSMHFITGDGGFDFTINYNHQESLALRLILTQVAYAIGMQAKGGTFVLKMFDLFSKHPLIFYIFLLLSINRSILLSPIQAVLLIPRNMLCARTLNMNRQRKYLISFYLFYMFSII